MTYSKLKAGVNVLGPWRNFDALHLALNCVQPK
jgi:hypothetical protein